MLFRRNVWLLILGLLLPCFVQGQGTEIYLGEITYNENQAAAEIPILLLKDGKRIPGIADSDDFKLYSQDHEETARDSLGFVDKIQPVSEDSANYILLANYPLRKGFYGDLRKYVVEFNSTIHGTARAERYASIGSFVNPSDAVVGWADALVVGFCLVALMLLLMSELIPIWEKLRFRATYVKPYEQVAQARVKERDPMTGEFFMRKELVVTKCEHKHSLTTWEENGYQCLYFPDDCENGIGGSGAVGFFTMRDLYRPLNWLWFGALGGVFAWILQFGLQSVLPLEKIQWEEALIGFALGGGLSFMLAWVEERGQSRDFDWGRIVLRGLAGAVAGGLVFLLGYYLKNQVLKAIPYLFVKQGLVFLLFGAAIGAVLSIKSSISLVRGLAGGLLAAILGFTLYYFVYNSSNVGLAQIVSYLALGSVLGWGLATYIKRAENFELEYLSPPEYRRTVPLSKWLKANQEVEIGADHNCDVFIKWSDQDPYVEDRHAVLSLQNGQVFINPLAELLIEGRRMPLNQDIRLKDGDKIQLGRESITRIQFHEK